MGCAASRISKEERLQTCKERKRLIKQLLGYRGEFADAQVAYLKALKNTGVTLGQLTESESLDLDDLALPSSLPPSPPPPPFSSDLEKLENDGKIKFGQEERTEIAEGDTATFPLIPSSTSKFLDSFGPSSSHHYVKDEMEPVEKEEWAETRTEFEEEQELEACTDVISESCSERLHPVESVVHDSCNMSCHAEDTEDMPIVFCIKNKTLEGIAKELDDYFLKASAGVKEIAIIIDISAMDRSLPQRFRKNKRKGCSSPKVFSAFSWSRLSKSPQFTRDAAEISGPKEPCKPGAHCITLKNLYDEEQKLYKEVKEELITKIEYEKKSSLLQKQEGEKHDCTMTEKTRSCVENLEVNIMRIQQSISRTCSSILEIIDDELYPQLVTLTSGMLHIWRTMYECHHAQNKISQQLNHATVDQKWHLSNDYHCQPAHQLETEVTFWLHSFCKLVQSQRDYVRTLCRWIQLTDSLADNDRKSVYSSSLHRLCEGWQHGLDRIPDKVVSDAIKSLWSATNSMILQQEMENSLRMKCEKHEKRMQKELCSLAVMKRELEGGFAESDASLDLKQAKADALRKQVDHERAIYFDTVQTGKTMTLNSLTKTLPSLFKAMMGFSNASIEAIESALTHMQAPDLDTSLGSVPSPNN